MKKMLILLSLMVVSIILVACHNEPTVFEPIEFELPQFTVEADEVPTGYYNIYDIEIGEVIYENLSADEVGELELDENQEARPVYAIPIFTFALELDSEDEIEDTLTASGLVSTTLVAEVDTYGIATFENVVFDEAGTFAYTVWQTTDVDDFEYWELDETVHSFVIEVTENEELGILEAFLIDETNFLFLNIFTYELEEVAEGDLDVEAVDEENEENEENETNVASSNNTQETTETPVSNNTANNSNNNNASANNSSNNASNNNNASANNSSNNASNNTNTNANQYYLPAPVCRNVWIETSPAVPAVAGIPDDWIFGERYYVHIVLPNRTEFAIGQEIVRNDYIFANNQISFTTVGRIPIPIFVPGTPDTPEIPAQGHYEQHCD